MQFVDSHCHLDRVDLTPFNGDFSTMMRANLEAGVEHMLCIGVEQDGFGEVLDIAEAWPQVSASVGVHPLFVKPSQQVTQAWIEQQCAHPKVVGIGETGLDYFKAKEEAIALQQAAFRTHIQAAKNTGLPLIIHTRNAKADTLDILRTEGEGKVTGVLHCFTEDLDMAEQAIELGFYISLSGILTFANAKELRATAQALPLSRLLIETDSPWLAPVPYRGKSNVPAYVSKVAEQLAELHQVSTAEVAQQTQKNFFSLFSKAQRIKS